MRPEDRRQLVQLGAAALAHHLRGDQVGLYQLLSGWRSEPFVALDALAGLCVVTSEALAVLRGIPAEDVLRTLPAGGANPTPGVAVQRAAAVEYVVGLVERDADQTRRSADAFGDLATAINSTLELSAALVRDLAGGRDAALVASRIAVLGAIGPLEAADSRRDVREE
jgi:hypothetical protein